MADFTSRETAVDPRRTALLIIDVQNYCAHPQGSEFADREASDELAYYFDRLESAVANMRRLQECARASAMEVLYSVIENQTLDGRDRSLDYKLSGISVQKGSWDAEVLDAIAPQAGEMVIPKTSSSVFISTNIDYVLRNLGVRQLVICGVVTDQCIESAVRDACDLGYLVTLVPDACATFSDARQEASVRAIAGYCRQLSTEDLTAELGAIAAKDSRS